MGMALDKSGHPRRLCLLRYRSHTHYWTEEYSQYIRCASCSFGSSSSIIRTTH